MREITKLIVGAFLTMTIELIVLRLEKVKDERLWLSLPMNLFTNMLFNSILSFIDIAWLSIFMSVVGEILVFLVEWGLFQLMKKDSKNWWHSFSANLASLTIGSLLAYILFLFV